MSTTVVLVHGGFVDGSGWRGVYDELRADGIDVRVVQNATKSLADDAATTRDMLDAVDGPVILVGHSYGGAVITEAGNHEKVASLVYVTAFAPDQGNPSTRSSAGSRRMALSLRFCRPSTGTSSSTGRSSMNRSRLTCRTTTRLSRPTRKFHGDSRRSAR
jgi:pimeloyl-ACP methyl ester carboxylesterase